MSWKELKPVRPGDQAPDFELVDQSHQRVRLSDYRGKKNVVLAFYAFDWSPVCAMENAGFSKDAEAFASAGAEVLCISVDSTWCHKAWADAMGYRHRLLADVSKTVISRYGLLREDLGCAERAVVIVDKAGRVAHVQTYDMRVPPKNEGLLELVRALDGAAGRS